MSNIDENFILEESGINIENEKSLHSSLKNWYYAPGDRLEAKVGKYIVDIVREDLLIEIQTRNISKIKDKLKSLSKKHRVCLVYPLIVEKWITVLGSDGTILRRRKSPKIGRIEDVFDELVRTPLLINEENLYIEIPMIKVEEIRANDGKGSWRRKGISIIDRQLIDVTECIRINTKEDFGRYLPENLSQPFTNKDLAECAGITVNKACKMTYCFKKMGVIKEIGKKGRSLLFEIC